MNAVFTLNAQAACLTQFFDFMEGVQFWAKDAAGRYVTVNLGFLPSAGLQREAAWLQAEIRRGRVG